MLQVGFRHSHFLFCFSLQTPTPKQSKYKEQVAEMRKGRNSGLQKEQKEKHMVMSATPYQDVTATK